ncbi:Hypothetical protein NTJ_12449 [Nesidiocoris tenuis]|uniref:Uncharacterized protein n=1 Tax=Nesidiocoris tenuis TaxID=355587 RepID=A0ABN7B8Z9_9HEMI|nr:Hypothetical protein NTJ_12449 [Nesidiocoris tenuis]
MFQAANVDFRRKIISEFFEPDDNRVRLKCLYEPICFETANSTALITAASKYAAHATGDLLRNPVELLTLFATSSNAVLALQIAPPTVSRARKRKIGRWHYGGLTTTKISPP